MVEIVTTMPAFFALEREWNELVHGLAPPLLTHEYFAACVEAYQPDRLAVIVLRDGARIQAIAPLYVTTYGGISSLKRLKLLSHAEEEPSGLLYRDEAALTALLRTLLNMRIPFKLSRLGADSAEAAILRQLTRDHGILVEHPAPSTLIAPLTHGFAEIELRMSKSNRSDLRRYRKRAEQYGPVEVETSAPGERDVDRFLDEFVRIEGSGWKHRAGTAARSLPYKERFLRTYGKAAAKQGRLRVFVLKIGGNRVAVRLADAYAARLWDHRIAHDEKWRACAPGILLTHETLRYACEQGFEAHEYLGKAEPWQKNWPWSEQRSCTMNYYPPGLAGLGLFAVQWGWDQLLSGHVRRALKRVIRPK